MPMRVPMVNLRKQGSKPWEGLGSRDHQSSGGRDGRVPGAVSGRGRGSSAHGWRAWGPWSQPTPNHLTLQGSVQGWALGPGAGPEPRQRQPEPPRAQRRARGPENKDTSQSGAHRRHMATGAWGSAGPRWLHPSGRVKEEAGPGPRVPVVSRCCACSPSHRGGGGTGSSETLHSWLCRLLGAHEERSCLAWDPGAGVGWECGCQLGT